MSISRRNIKGLIIYAVMVLIISLPVAADSSLTPFEQREKYALVIGISEYDQWPELPHAVCDAKMISQLFIKGGFNVSSLYNPSSRKIKKEFQRFTDEIGIHSGRDIVIYYSGHGLSKKNDQGKTESWLIPKDCPPYREKDMAFYKRAINSTQIKNYSTEIKSTHMLWFIDADLSGEMYDIQKPVLRLRSKKATRQMIISSASKRDVSKRIFRKFLIKGLCGEADTIRDGYISGSELGVYLSTQISLHTKDKQRPQFASLNRARKFQGDFIFKTFPEFKQSSLSISVIPKHALISFVDSKLTYKHGMVLNPGKHRLRINASGYTSKRLWIEVNENEEKHLDIELKRSEERYINSLGMIFLSIPTGKFSMGATDKRKKEWVDLETPSRTVRLTQRFFMQSTEVSVKEFTQFIKETTYKTSAEKSGGCWIKSKDNRWKKGAKHHWRNPGSFQSKHQKQNLAHPVTCISYHDAKAFIQWLKKKEKKKYSLPTEAQWEYACRAGTKTPFYSGNCLSTETANYAELGAYYPTCGKYFKKSRKMPMGITDLQPNQWGLYHMHGNVSEWCRDWFAAYPSKKSLNPKGPGRGMERVIRGGHYLSQAIHLRSSSRSSLPPNVASDAVGFRLVINE